ncbi:MAG: prepilin-type N-terminal cleavage/methylation domain-containing protein [Gemmatimonadaceae bacterium]|nr:prepilin-type N-terminal cleavage/methylation domain-containing protein [Gemmatimonadaceae bacterium]
MTTAPRLRARPGLTLVELTVSLLIFSLVMAGALSMLKSESRRFQLGGERSAIYQNGRFALNELEKDLRTSGAGAPDIQPQMVYLSDSVLVFNANYWTNTAGDVEAVYYSADAPDSAVAAMRTNSKITIPYTAIQYPDTNYLVAGLNSSAETMTFYFRADSSTARTDDYILWRRINNLTPEVVSSNILRSSNEPFFRYFRLFATSSAQWIDTVPRNQLPMRHQRPIHLANNDTGTLARIDSIRGIRVSFTVTNGRVGDAAGEQTRALTRLIRLPNVGLTNTKTCGDEPLFTSNVTGVAGVMPDSVTRFVRINFLRSVDELTGEKDVERYVIWRRGLLATDWGDPLVTIPGGDSLYTYIDQTVEAGQSYRYAVSAQDCTPSLSSQRTSSIILVL